MFIVVKIFKMVVVIIVIVMVKVACFDQELSFPSYMLLALMVKMIMMVKVFKLPVFTRG